MSALDLARWQFGIVTVCPCISGGQAQGLSLARALHADPTVLVLDEPTAGPDGGRMVKSGRHDPLVERPRRYRELWTEELRACSRRAGMLPWWLRPAPPRRP